MSYCFTDAAIRERLARNVEALEAAIRSAFRSLTEHGHARLRTSEGQATRLVVTHLLGRLWWRTAVKERSGDAGRETIGDLLDLLLEPLAEKRGPTVKSR